MKQRRYRRHLRPMPTRSQIRRQLARIRSSVELFKVEALLEAEKSHPNVSRLHFLGKTIDLMFDEIGSLERLT